MTKESKIFTVHLPFSNPRNLKERFLNAIWIVENLSLFWNQSGDLQYLVFNPLDEIKFSCSTHEEHKLSLILIKAIRKK